MPNIHITPNEEQLLLTFTFNTPQQFAYTVTVNDPNDVELYSGNGQFPGGKTQFPLLKSSQLLGNTLNIAWTIIDPAGAGNKYGAQATVEQNGEDCPASQTIAGNTTSNVKEDFTTGDFVSGN